MLMFRFQDSCRMRESVAAKMRAETGLGSKW